MSRKQRSRRHSGKRLWLEALEQRCLLDAQLGELIAPAASNLGTSVQDLNPPPSGEQPISEISRFESAAELEEFLIRDANRRYGDVFGKPAWYPPWPIPLLETDGSLTADVNGVRADSADFSGTNIQVAGVDEADIVKTDGQYLYLSGDRNVTIVDASVPTDLSVVSRVEIDNRPIAMYLSDDRLTVISTDFRGDSPPDIIVPAVEMPLEMVSIWPPLVPHDLETVFTVLDVSSPDQPLLIEQIAIQGRYTDSRMIDGTVLLVSDTDFHLPPPQIVPGPTENDQSPENPGVSLGPALVDEAVVRPPDWIAPPGQMYFYETAEEYWARIGDQVLELVLPEYTSYGPDGQEFDAGFLSQPEEIYKPLGPNDDRLVSITAINVSADDLAIVSSTSAPIDWTSEVYVSPENLYLISPQSLPTVDGETGSGIYKFNLDTEGDGISLMATGHVPGRVLDQFSMDEYDGYLRIVTQRGWRQTARSDLFVLQQDGDRLNVVGAVEELAPGERLFSVRFVDQLAFVVTFGPNGGRWFDPLFTVDLSDPANPQVRGELEIPGFSNYLQLIDGEYLIGLGRNADETNGRPLEPQISLYDVGDLDNPQLADRLPFAQEGRAWSEAFTDHHAISYFPDYAVLAIPLHRYGPIPDPAVEPSDGEASGSLDAPRSRHQSALWVFRIDVQADANKIELLGQIEHRSNLRRSVRIGDVLFSISHETVKVHEILDPDAQLGEVHYGRLVRDDQFTVDRNSVDNPLDVLRNDVAVPNDGQGPIITTVGKADKGGEVTIAEDGRSLLYTPPDGFAGVDSFTYTIVNGPSGEDTATVTVRVRYVIDEDSVDNVLDVLAWLHLPYEEPATITAAEAVRRGSEVTITEDGQSLVYSPARDLAGWGELVFTVGYDGREETSQHRLIVHINNVDDDPIAEDDHFVLQADHAKHVLDVLRNDTHPDLGERLTITRVGPVTGGGTVTIGFDGRRLVYEPGANRDLKDSFTYTISDKNGDTDEATVTIELVRPDDSLRMVRLAKQHLAGLLGVPIEAIGVVSVEEVVWSDGCMGIYEDGTACATVIVPGFRILLQHRDTGYAFHTDKRDTVLLAGSFILEDQVRVRVEAVDGTGEVVTTVEAGDEFYLNVYVRDLRDRPEGVYSAYVDVMFFNRLVSAGGEISYGDDYQNGQSGSMELPGLVDELGAFASFGAVGDREALLASIPFSAHRPGLASFVLTPADKIGSEVLLYGHSEVVPPARVAYTGTQIEVVRGWSNAVKPSDVNGDGGTTSLDVLALVQDLNQRGSRQLGQLEHASGEAPEAAHYYPDVNRDGSLSTLDALIVISELNALGAGVGAAGPNAQDETNPPLAELVDWAAFGDVLHEELWTAPLDTLDLSPDEALDLAHQSLVNVDSSVLADGIPADWSSEEIPDLLQQWFEDHPDELSVEQYTEAFGQLDALIESLDLDQILPGVAEDINLAQSDQAFRDQLFAGLATQILRDQAQVS